MGEGRQDGEESHTPVTRQSASQLTRGGRCRPAQLFGLWVEVGGQNRGGGGGRTRGGGAAAEQFS